MAKETIETLVEGGKASGGPPIGPALGPLGVNISEVVSAINQKTGDLEGMKVPVKIIVDLDTKKFEIEIGTPPTSALIKKELGIEKGTQDGSIVANLTIDQSIKIARMKGDSLIGKNLKSKVKEIIGTCVSLGVSIEDINPRNVFDEIDAGKFDAKFET